MLLSGPMQAFVRHWGEMGTRWGVNRSVAQIHALLFLADAALPADEIAETLGIARSNVSTSLKELMTYRLVDLVHVQGDRRDHFAARQDPWDMLIAITDERKRREMDPTIELLRECAADAGSDAGTPDSARQRMVAMRDFLEELDRFYDRLRRVPQSRLRRVLRLGDKIIGLLQR